MSEKIRADQVHSAVRQRYGQIARDFAGEKASCCASSCSCAAEPANSLVQTLYQTPDVAELPPDVTGLSLGCGDPVTLASLQAGQTVLDLGAGGGIDCFLAARQVGTQGRVIGVDMTAEMIEKARANARKMNAENVEFRLGEIEHLPVADASVDVIISNCVINLSPDKPQVFREAYRALRPGGRLAVSDIVTRVQLPAEMQANLGAWAACVAGAWTDKDYVAAIQEAGFTNIHLEEKQLEEAVIADGADQMDVQIDINAVQNVIYSARVTAVKPH